MNEVHGRQQAADVAVEFLAQLSVSARAAHPFTEPEFRRLAGLVARFDEVMPGVACDLLDVPRGSTYADGVSSRSRIPATPFPASGWKTA